ncbi:HD domain-containing protein [Clostridium sp. 'White wine YQ']|uniref:HD domain-containing protein n=1 Tax=Clostridium sp. 'White wine YQ' TaxID=3027474 RepID=UPI002365B8DE|nr:HD domain-containing protein [Clostridium sp. 'White wine YQ']MDD7794272.1 HD domain-containing protein [Clostridium sp. 'White wine YQ']
MNRLEEIRKLINNILIEGNISEEKSGVFAHLYGVSNTCSLLALKRGLNVEISAVIGMLHDISTYKTHYTPEHGILGAIEAKKILEESKLFNENEITIVCSAISKHSNKNDIDNEYDEVLKDADVLQHYLYNTSFEVNEKEKDRLSKILSELGIVSSV